MEQEVSFGDFSDKEVSDLYTQNVDNVEFVWQRMPCSPAQSSHSGELRRYALGNASNTPDKQKFTLGGISPNIPPNPPTSPVEGLCEDRSKSPSRLNINALPFVPGNLSLIVPPKNSASKNSPTSQSGVSRKLYVGTCEDKAREEECLKKSNVTENIQSGWRKDEFQSFPRAIFTGGAEPLAKAPKADSETTNTTPLPPEQERLSIPLFYSATPTPPHTTHSSHPHTSPPHTSTATSPITTPESSTQSTNSMAGPTPSDLNLTQGVPPQTTASVWSNTKSWASILNKPSVNAGPSQPQRLKVTVGVATPGQTATVVDEQSRNTQLQELAKQLSQWKMSHKPVSFQPRGLVNQGNWCYMHAPLQALLSCPGFFNLFQSLANSFPVLTRGPSPSPVADAMIQFIEEFKPYPQTPVPQVSQADSKSKKKRSGYRDFHYGDPYRPDCVYNMLHKIRSNLSVKGRQEDAEEFLGCVLDGLHEEMVCAQGTLQPRVREDETITSQAAVSSSAGEASGASEGVEWEEVGPKNKSAITRQTSFQESPITEIFGGELRSSVHRQKAKESATLQPFFSLQLDIQSETVWTVQDALEVLSAKETVHMSESEAHKRLTLARLPPVLILHLKRFVFDKTGGSQKLLKHVQYTIDMEIGKDLLSPAIKSKLSVPQRSYRLWAVVYHHGKTAAGGHYTCDVLHPVCGGWVRADDSLLKGIPDEFVLKPAGSQANKVAYLLFYRRLDTIT